MRQQNGMQLQAAKANTPCGGPHNHWLKLLSPDMTHLVRTHVRQLRSGMANATRLWDTTHIYTHHTYDTKLLENTSPQSVLLLVPQQRSARKIMPPKHPGPVAPSPDRREGGLLCGQLSKAAPYRTPRARHWLQQHMPVGDTCVHPCSGIKHKHQHSCCCKGGAPVPGLIYAPRFDADRPQLALRHSGCAVERKRLIIRMNLAVGPKPQGVGWRGQAPHYAPQDCEICQDSLNKHNALPTPGSVGNWPRGICSG